MTSPRAPFRLFLVVVALLVLGVTGAVTAMRLPAQTDPSAEASPVSGPVGAFGEPSPGGAAGGLVARAADSPPEVPGAAAVASETLAPPPARIRDEAPPPVTARYIAIVDEDSGELLFGQGEDVRIPPASVTKIATTLVALQREPDLDRVIPITIDGPAMAAADGSQIIGLEPGEEVRLRTLLYGIMLWSGNDAAEQVAFSLADGSRERYVQWMNELAASLGLQDTHFANPSGMDANGHYSSAADMAYLARVAMRDPMFRRLAETRRYEADGYPLVTLNRLLDSYPGADGVKIGYTDKAGRTMVASATRDGHRVYVSIMRSEDLVGDQTALLDWVWRTYRW